MARGSCPPGVFCLSEGILVVLGVVLLFLFIVIYLMKAPHTIVFPSQHQPMPPSPPTVMIQGGGDSRYDRAPQPLRDWMGRPEFPPRGGLSSLPINIPTQGLPESFQSVGIIIPVPIPITRSLSLSNLAAAIAWMIRVAKRSCRVNPLRLMRFIKKERPIFIEWEAPNIFQD